MSLHALFTTLSLFTYFTTEDHVLLAVLNSARSFLSVAGGELVTDLRDPHRPDANLDELVGVGVQGHHHLVHDTSLRVSEICISSLVITHFFLFLLWKKNFLFLKYVQEGAGDVENSFINPSNCMHTTATIGIFQKLPEIYFVF